MLNQYCILEKKNLRFPSFQLNTYPLIMNLNYELMISTKRFISTNVLTIRGRSVNRIHTQSLRKLYLFIRTVAYSNLKLFREYSHRGAFYDT